MMYPHLIDALRSGKNIFDLPGADKYRLEIADLLAKAEPFEFTEIPLEPSGTDHAYKTPVITDDELECLKEGLIPLPSDPAYYEFTLANKQVGILVTDGFRCMRFDVTEDRTYLFDACWVSPLNDTQTALQGPKEMMDLLRQPKNAKHLERMDYASIPTIAMYLTLMLGSKTTEVRDEPAPVKLNKRRLAKGLTPLPAHRVVTIIPLAYRSKPRGSGSHASPRVHWRRSHVRTLGRGEGKGRKVVVVRHLVGRAELGEVSHEYRVMGQKKGPVEAGPGEGS